MNIAAPPTSFRSRTAECEARIMEKTRGSRERFERSKRTLAGGVSSSLRRSARPYPLFFSHGQGAEVFDVDENRYLDYGLAWGPLILGHADPEVTAAVTEQASRGLTFGAQHDLEYQVSELLTETIPSADLVCFASSGTEAVQVAIRLARAATGRTRFLKFEGHYHGWMDNVLCSYHPTAEAIKAANGAPVPGGPGQAGQADTLVLQWNDTEGLQRLFAAQGDDIAAVICEPLLCNSGCIPAEPGFLAELRRITRAHGAVLIFDEVITGFRLDLGGAQAWYGVMPDLCVFAKAIGAGVAISVLAGSLEYMGRIGKGEVFHAGTLNGNPLALAACGACVGRLKRDADTIYPTLRARGTRLRGGLQQILQQAGLAVVTQGEGPVFQLAFMASPARNYRETLAADRPLYSDFALAMLDQGILALPDGRWYISAAHTDADIDATLEAARRVIAQ
jgi:glutamate-1-semialdehyde 2,1-aminomutase